MSNQTQSVLIVDDENDIRELLKGYLEHNGYTVQEASNGKVALNLIQSQTFDVIITDLKMPVLTGEEFLEAAHKLGISSKIIVITGGSQKEQTEKQLETIKKFSKGFLSKPFDRKTLLNLIRSV